MLQVANKKTKSLWPVVPPFSMSPPISIIIGDAEHTIIYGPYQSEKYTGPFPYKHTAGLEFYNQNYQTFLTSRSRIMNPLYAPKLSDSGNTRVDYFSKQKSASQKGANTLMQQLLDTLCGMKLTHAETPEAYTELRELLDKHQVVCRTGVDVGFCADHLCTLQSLTVFAICKQELLHCHSHCIVVDVLLQHSHQVQSGCQYVDQQSH